MPSRPARVLHVLGSLNRGGAETWAIQLLSLMDRRKVEMDLLVHKRGGAYEETARDLGARIYTLESHSSPVRYMRELRGLLSESGPYDVVHTHLQLFSGIVLRCAAQVGVPGRIAHARNSADGRGLSLARAAYRRLMRYWLAKYATQFFAVSRLAGQGAFGAELAREDRCALLTGIDFSAFEVLPDREELRRSLGIEPEHRAVGHLGSFRRQKNHAHLVRVAQVAASRDPRLLFVLMGDGPLREETEASVRAAGLSNSFRFLGEKPNAAQLLVGMDAFLFPSFHEGLPRVLIEAQAAGLPCVASTAITSEAAAEEGRVTFVSLDASIEAWVAALERALEEGTSAEKGREAIECFTRRGMTIEANALTLTALYQRIALSHSH